MPYSWVEVPTDTSDKMRKCMNGDKGRARFCAERIAREHGGSVLGFQWVKDQVGRRASVHLFGPTQDALDAIIADLDAQYRLDVVDFVEIDDMTDEAI